MKDYCGECGGKLITQAVNYDAWIDNNLMVIKNVPADVCIQCGEKYLSPEVCEKLDELTTKQQFEPEEVISVPITAYQKVAV
jgi:YgiT-type zinc finger domain-containing protein